LLIIRGYIVNIQMMQKSLILLFPPLYGLAVKSRNFGAEVSLFELALREESRVGKKAIH